MNSIAIRPVRRGELEAVARLRWEWSQENGRAPVTSRHEFVQRFVTWARQNESSHRCLVLVREDTGHENTGHEYSGHEYSGHEDIGREDAVHDSAVHDSAVHDGAVIGMAWLAITQRVPHPGGLMRTSGDLQCVYVVPDERDRGLGGRLVDAVLALARETGLERLTVHSSDQAVPAYVRAGFVRSPRLLQAEVEQAD